MWRSGRRRGISSCPRPGTRLSRCNSHSSSPRLLSRLIAFPLGFSFRFSPFSVPRSPFPITSAYARPRNPFASATRLRRVKRLVDARLEGLGPTQSPQRQSKPNDLRRASPRPFQPSARRRCFGTRMRGFPRHEKHENGLPRIPSHSRLERFVLVRGRA